MAYTTIDKPTDYFNTVLYTGNTTDDRTISGVGFQPDWNWTKNRSSAQNHWLADSVRGSTKIIRSDTTNTEVTAPSLGSIASFNSDGYVLQAGSSNDNNYNTNSDNYVSWNWLAGGTASSNTDGTLTSSVSASTTSGFSIASYTGSGSVTSFGHGLGVAPSMVIIKNRDDIDNWTVFHLGISSGQGYIYLNITDASITGSSRRFRYGDDNDGKIPDSSKVYLGTSSDVNQSGEDYIAYCFAEKKGFSKMGSYVGNGNSDGTFVYTGFKPAFLMVKKSSASGSDWNLHHNKSPGFNVNDNYLAPNSSASEVTNNSFQIFDLLSNGFKCRGTGTGTNASGETHIYMAFAENPFVTSTGIPTTAR